MDTVWPTTTLRDCLALRSETRQTHITAPVFRYPSVSIDSCAHSLAARNASSTPRRLIPPYAWNLNSFVPRAQSPGLRFLRLNTTFATAWRRFPPPIFFHSGEKRTCFRAVTGILGTGSFGPLVLKISKREPQSRASTTVLKQCSRGSGSTSLLLITNFVIVDNKLFLVIKPRILRLKPPRIFADRLEFGG